MKNPWKLLWGVLPLALLLSSGGCYYDNNQELHPETLLGATQCDTSGTMSYQANIVPILKNSCGSENSCHNASGAGGGVVLNTYAGVNASVGTGKLWSAISWDGNASQMPKNSASQLNDCYMSQLYKWIQAGAPNN